MRKIKLSGKFLVNLISGKYPCFILEKIPPLEGEISHQIDIQKDIEFIIKEYGDWQTKGEGSYYFNQDLHKNSVTRIKTFVEPALIILLTAMVGVIVLSIVVPMFSMYSQIQA